MHWNRPELEELYTLTLTFLHRVLGRNRMGLFRMSVRVVPRGGLSIRTGIPAGDWSLNRLLPRVCIWFCKSEMPPFGPRNGMARLLVCGTIRSLAWTVVNSSGILVSMEFTIFTPPPAGSENTEKPELMFCWVSRNADRSRLLENWPRLLPFARGLLLLSCPRATEITLSLPIWGSRSINTILSLPSFSAVRSWNTGRFPIKRGSGGKKSPPLSRGVSTKVPFSKILCTLRLVNRGMRDRTVCLDLGNQQ